MNTSRPTAIDLFAGVGGMSLGFEQAGFDVLGAVEYDPVHAASHHFNFPHTDILPRSVADVSGRDIRALSQVGDREIDVVFGGAPCQGFSMIGQRVLDDPRNSLVRDFLRIVLDLEAGYFVFENVKGLTVGKHRKFLDQLVEEFQKSGYEVQLPWQVLHADNYGVPQARQRLFLLGARKGLPLPSYPSVVCSSPKGNSEIEFDLMPIGPTVQDALADVPDADQFAELLEGDCVPAQFCEPLSPYAKEMRCAQRQHWHWGYQREWDCSILSSSARTAHTAISKRRFRETKGGETEPISRFFRLSGQGVSNTLRAGSDSARGAFTSPRPIHHKHSRCVTVREMARLHGFPDWFRFHHTKWHGARQIGNAVPPPLARHVAGEIIKAMGHKRNRPRKTYSLGDDSLLYMDMKQAAAFWDVPVPIRGRDRKSGSRKRSQEEIERDRLSVA